MKRQWSTQTRFFITGILLILSIVFLSYIHELITPLIISALLAYVLHPMVAGLENRTPIKHKWSVFLVYMAFLAILVVIPAVVTPIIIKQIESADIEVHIITDAIEEFLNETEVLGFPVFQGLAENFGDSFSQSLNPGQLFESVQALTENLIWVIMVLILIYYMLLDWEKMRLWVYNQIPKPYQVDGLRLYQRLSVIWKTFLRGQLLTIFLLGMISGVAAAILGLPGAIIIGLVSALLAVLPSVGSSSMAFIAGVIAFFSESSTLNISTFWYVAITLGVFTGIHMFDNYWLRPRVLGRGLDLHPAVVLFSVIGALTMGGLLMVLIVVPVISSIGTILRYVKSRLVGEDPWEAQEETG